MPVVTIDGRSIEVDSSTTILEAARMLGIHIPVFCYHKGLSVAANCRMCLVEVKGSLKPLPSCEVLVRDGMEVFTTSEFAVKARKGMLEFILANHPIDCPVCDCAGECMLQDHYFEQSAQPSRMNVHKEHKAKMVSVGPTIVLDKERCINCTRCVRFLREVTGSEQLIQTRRGNTTEITVFPGKVLDDPYSLCVVDLCPVGALTSKDFRFKKRVWWLESGESICSECSRGCNVHVDHADGKVFRLHPRYNEAVNRWWMCDDGRLSTQGRQDRRPVQARVRLPDGSTSDITPREAVDRSVASLKSIREAGGRVVVWLSAFASLEDGFAAISLARSCFGEHAIYFDWREDGPGDRLLRVSDRNPNREGILQLANRLDMKTVSDLQPHAAEIRGIIFVGTEFPVPQLPEDMRLEFSVALTRLEDELTQRVHVVVPVLDSQALDSMWFAGIRSHHEWPIGSACCSRAQRSSRRDQT